MTQTTPTRRLDAARAYRVLDLIQANPEHHDQAFYFNDPYAFGTEARSKSYNLDSFRAACGTTACFAGWTLLDQGYQFMDLYQVATSPQGREVENIEVEAGRLLGLTDSERRRLFHCLDNDQVPALVEEIFGPRPEVTG